MREKKSGELETREVKKERTHVSLLEESERRDGRDQISIAPFHNTDFETHCRICSSSDSSFLLCETKREDLISFAHDLGSSELNKTTKERT